MLSTACVNPVRPNTILAANWSGDIVRDSCDLIALNRYRSCCSENDEPNEAEIVPLLNVLPSENVVSEP